MDIVFIGTSEFAVPALKEIHFSRHRVLEIVTRPDSSKGRNRKIYQPPVKKVATQLGYKVSQPNKINNENFISHLKSLKPDLFVVLAFGQILCGHLLEVPKKGAINVHPSLIPKYRGAAPIQWAIINGDTETGVTTILMDSGIDTGCKLLSQKTEIRPYETSASLNIRLSKIAPKLLLQTIDKIEDGSIIPIPQDQNSSSKAPIFKKEDGEINWNTPAKNIETFIRGMNPWPGAFTFYNNKRFKIIEASIVDINSNKTPGTVLYSSSETLFVAARKSTLSVQTIQGEASKKMPIKAFLCGCRFPTGSILGSQNKM